MPTKKIHKMVRKLKASGYRLNAEFQLCNGKRCDFSEHTSYFWKNVSCPKCKALRK